MKWFRSNIKGGARLALLALAIQFALSFAHFHGTVAQAAAASQASAVNSVQPQPGSDRESDQPNDTCAICAVMALANSVLFAAPPILLLPQVFEFLYQITDAEFAHLNSARVAFQPRAPPAS